MNEPLSGSQMRRTKAALPTAGVHDDARAFASDGRKDAEGAGAGTGVPVWFNEADKTWRTFTTGAEVEV